MFQSDCLITEQIWMPKQKDYKLLQCVSSVNSIQEVVHDLLVKGWRVQNCYETFSRRFSIRLEKGDRIVTVEEKRSS